LQQGGRRGAPLGGARRGMNLPGWERLEQRWEPTVIDIGTTLNQRFLLEKELGRGGMGAVYSATDQLLERKVAIKVLKEQSGEEVGKKLRLEAQIAARLLHENVVRIYDLGQAEAAYFLVMEQVNGTSYSKRWKHLPLAERLQILAQVAEALDYAHHQGVVHRDVKPANVLLNESDVPKLSDFGLSMVAEKGDHSGVVRGTPHYMSPEQTRGTRLDYRTDLYSLGVMIYESATGGVPFAGTSVSIMSQHYSVEPERPRVRSAEVSQELEALILSLLSKRPGDRPGSGSMVAAALREEIERIRERGRSGVPVARPGADAGASMSRTVGMTEGPPTEPARGDRSRSTNGPSAEKVAISQVVPSPAGSSTEVGPSIESAATKVSSRASTKGSGHAVVVTRPGATVAGTGGMIALVRSPLVRRMLEQVLAEPVLLTPDERYLHGHYLAYLLSGSRRRGLFLRRPLDPRNADRGRLLLGMTFAVNAEGNPDAIRDAAAILDQRIEVRPVLSPIVVAKYLACRESPAKRKLFRQTRKAIADASTYAQKHLIDAKGVLNPGLMPQRLDDLILIAPARTEVDDVLVERWNRVADVWRNDIAFRTAVLRYATKSAHRDPASTGLWPEVVYPLIERARWHRRMRNRTETIWDYLSGRLLHVPDAGIVLDRALVRSVPAPLVASLDDSLDLMVENPRLDDDADPFAPAADEADRLTATLTSSQVSLVDLAAEPVDADKDKGVLRLADSEPLRFSQAQLHELWKEALNALQSQAHARPGTKPSGHRPVPIGPYQLAVIPSIRGRAAGQIAIQGMRNKQIELTTPTVRTKGSGSKMLVAIWVYCDNSLVIVHLDFQGVEHYVLWHAPRGHQLNFDGPTDLNHELYTLGLELPAQLDRVLSRSFKSRRSE
jgi:serine/threonine protein kinase